jgi:hypothetical protein
MAGTGLCLPTSTTKRSAREMCMAIVRRWTDPRARLCALTHRLRARQQVSFTVRQAPDTDDEARSFNVNESNR